MTSRELFKLGFRIAESIYRKPGQPVKSESEIMAEFPDIPASTVSIKEGRWSDYKTEIKKIQAGLGYGQET